MSGIREDNVRVSPSGAASAAGTGAAGIRKEGRELLRNIETFEGDVDARGMSDCDDAVLSRRFEKEATPDRGGRLTTDFAEICRTDMCLIWLLATERLVRVRGVVERERKPRSVMDSDGWIDRECVETLSVVRNV